MAVNYWSALFDLTGASHMLGDVRRLWKATGGDEPLPTGAQTDELRLYYEATIQNIMFELEELNTLSTQADSNLPTKFIETHKLLCRQLQLLMGLGMLLLPPPRQSAFGTGRDT